MNAIKVSNGAMLLQCRTPRAQCCAMLLQCRTDRAQSCIMLLQCRNSVVLLEHNLDTIFCNYNHDTRISLINVALIGIPMLTH